MAKYPRSFLLAVVVSLGFAVADAAHAAQSAPPQSSMATYEGRTIDLTKGWSGAGACTTDGISTQCFRTESEMDRYLSTQDTASEGLNSDSVSAQSTCSSSLRLYDWTGYGGDVLNLSNRNTWLSLATRGFDNKTSSYKIGSCSSNLADYTNGGGSWYPGGTSAGAQSSSMQTGWDNRVSSVFIK